MGILHNGTICKDDEEDGAIHSGITKGILMEKNRLN